MPDGDGDTKTPGVPPVTGVLALRASSAQHGLDVAPGVTQEAVCPGQRRAVPRREGGDPVIQRPVEKRAGPGGGEHGHHRADGQWPQPTAPFVVTALEHQGQLQPAPGRQRREVEHLVGPGTSRPHRAGGGHEAGHLGLALLGPARVVGRAQAPGAGGPVAGAHRAAPAGQHRVVGLRRQNGELNSGRSMARRRPTISSGTGTAARTLIGRPPGPVRPECPRRPGARTSRWWWRRWRG